MSFRLVCVREEYIRESDAIDDTEKSTGCFFCIGVFSWIITHQNGSGLEFIATFSDFKYHYKF